MNLLDNKKHNPYREFHPYPPFVPPDATKLIIGSFPPIKLTRSIIPDNHDLVIELYNRYLSRNPKKPGDLEFYYGSEENLFWKLLGDIYKTQLSNLDKTKDLLIEQRTAVTDVIELCVRKLIDKSNGNLVFPTDIADLEQLPFSLKSFRKSDLIQKQKEESPRFGVSSGDKCLCPIIFRDIPAILRDNKTIIQLIFSSINAFQLCKKAFSGMQFKNRGNEYHVILANRTYRIHVLPSPSGSANKSIGRTKEYKNRNDLNPSYNTYQYRLDVYRKTLQT